MCTCQASLVQGTLLQDTTMTTTVDERPVIRRDHRGVATLTLNRPHQFNALSEALLKALGGELSRLANDGSVRCVRASGRSFAPISGSSAALRGSSRC